MSVLRLVCLVGSLAMIAAAAGLLGLACAIVGAMMWELASDA